MVYLAVLLSLLSLPAAAGELKGVKNPVDEDLKKGILGGK